jgi:xanthine dehydrogenase/oxidase
VSAEVEAAAIDALLKVDVPMPQGLATPGGRVAYRRVLAASFVRKALADLKPSLSLPPYSFRQVIPESFTRPESAGALGAAGVPNVASHKQLSGVATYTDDLAPLPGELVASIVMSPVAKGVLRGLDTSEALAVPGVRAVLTAADVPGSNTFGDIVEDEVLFVERDITAHGQTLALVIAETAEAAEAGAAAVKPDIVDESAEALVTIEDAIAANSFHTLPFNDGSPEHTVFRGRDVATSLAEAPHRVSGQVRLGGQEHFYFEPNVSRVIPLDGGDEFHIDASTQNCSKTQSTVASILGIPMSKVVVSAKRLGGGFGGKETHSIFVSALAALGSQHAGAPVRLLLARDVDMRLTGKRHPFLGRYEVGFDDEGKLLAAHIDLTSNGGNFFDLSGPVLDRAIMHADNCYHVPDMRVVGRIAKTNTVSNTAFRGFGGPQGMVVMETAVEHVAAKLGVEPEVVRRRNLYRAEDRTHFGQELKIDLPRLVDHADKESGFSERLLAEVASFNESPEAVATHRARGVALVPVKFGLAFTHTPLNQGSALVHVHQDGSVLVSHGGVEMGQGLHTKVAQVVAHELGVPLARVDVRETATDKIANSSATAASMGSDLYCTAAANACVALNKRLAPFRASLGTSDLAALATAAYNDRVQLSELGFHKVPHVTGFNFAAQSGQPFSYFTSGVAVSSVELDGLTGDWRCLSAHIVMDVGDSMSPSIDIGQIEGAFVQGAGWLTTEDMVIGDDARPWAPRGVFVNPGPGSYKIPSADDIPRSFVTELFPNSPNLGVIHSSRGVGEPPLFLGYATASALKKAAMALRRRTGTAADVEPFVPLSLPFSSEALRLLAHDDIVARVAGIEQPDTLRAGYW